MGKNRTFTKEFQTSAVRMVTEDQRSIREAAANPAALGASPPTP